MDNVLKDHRCPVKPSLAESAFPPTLFYPPPNRNAHRGSAEAWNAAASAAIHNHRGIGLALSLQFEGNLCVVMRGRLGHISTMQSLSSPVSILIARRFLDCAIPCRYLPAQSPESLSGRRALEPQPLHDRRRPRRQGLVSRIMFRKMRIQRLLPDSRSIRSNASSTASQSVFFSVQVFELSTCFIQGFPAMSFSTSPAQPR